MKTDFGLCGRRKNWLRKFFRFNQIWRQFNTADTACFFVINKAGTGNVTAYYTLHWYQFRLFNQHRSAVQYAEIGFTLLRKAVHIGRNQVILNDTGSPVKPKFRYLSQYFSFLRNSLVHYYIECG